MPLTAAIQLSERGMLRVAFDSLQVSEEMLYTSILSTGAAAAHGINSVMKD